MHVPINHEENLDMILFDVCCVLTTHIVGTTQNFQFQKNDFSLSNNSNNGAMGIIIMPTNANLLKRSTAKILVLLSSRNFFSFIMFYSILVTLFSKKKEKEKSFFITTAYYRWRWDFWLLSVMSYNFHSRKEKEAFYYNFFLLSIYYSTNNNQNGLSRRWYRTTLCTPPASCKSSFLYSVPRNLCRWRK